MINKRDLHIKVNKKELFKQLGLFVVFTLIAILLYGFLHETAHFIACKSLNLDASITIDLFQNPPLYVTNCPQANQLSHFNLFVIRSAPYLLSTILMLLLLIFFKPSKFYHLALPSGILLLDWLNVINLFTFFSNSLDYRNDILQMAVLDNKIYYFLILSFIGLTTMFYFRVLIKYSRVQPKKVLLAGSLIRDTLKIIINKKKPRRAS